MEKLINFIRNNIRLILGAAVVTFALLLVITILVNTNRKSPKVVVNDKAFKVTIARTEKEKENGLSNKDKIAQDQGMLFLFNTPNYYSFWMKEMKFPIDIIYINGNRVTSIIKNAKPPKAANGNLVVYQPHNKSDKVLEVNAGLAQKYNIKEGTTVKIEDL